jgi:hypothetical protein
MTAVGWTLEQKQNKALLRYGSINTVDKVPRMYRIPLSTEQCARYELEGWWRAGGGLASGGGLEKR